MLSLDKSVFCCRFPRMVTRFIPILLASASLAAAQDPRIQLDDPNGGAGRIARSLLGEGGGNQLFYLPTRDEPATPASWGCKYENISFKSADGTALHGWFIPAKSKAPLGTVVFSHGNAGSIGHHLGFVIWLVEAGYHVMMYDYRGFGKSGGGVDRRGMVDDVKAAFSHIGKRPGVNPRRLVSYGHSLGGAKSVTALGEAPVRGLRAVVIDGAFASYKAMARIIGGQLGESLVTDELAPRDFVKKLSPVPLLVVHGARDEVVPVAQGRQLFQSAVEPKTMFEVEAGRHGDALSVNNGHYRKRMLVWLADKLDG
jgi:uncharacterized protein